MCWGGNKEGKIVFKLSEEPLEGKGCLKKPPCVCGVAGSYMLWWYNVVVVQVLSPPRTFSPLWDG